MNHKILQFFVYSCQQSALDQIAGQITSVTASNTIDFRGLIDGIGESGGALVTRLGQTDLGATLQQNFNHWLDSDPNLKLSTSEYAAYFYNRKVDQVKPT